MYGLRKYVQATGDESFLREYGAEMLVETARLWLDLGFYSDVKGGKFCINSVTGPDEYNTVVNNNAYTNLMARERGGWSETSTHKHTGVASGKWIVATSAAIPALPARSAAYG